MIDICQEYIYGLRATDKPALVKIGRTSKPAQRLSEFRVSFPNGCEFSVLHPCENNVWMESRLHQLFRDRLVNGEWFEAGDQELTDACLEMDRAYRQTISEEDAAATLNMLFL